MFSSAFFQRFFRGTVCLSSFVFPRAFLAFFLGRIGGILLSPYIVAQLACSSFCPMRLTLNHRSADLLPAPSMSALPFSEVLVAVFQQLLRASRFRFQTRLQLLWPTLFISPAQLLLLRFVKRTSLPVFQCGSSPVSSVVFLFPALFPALFQLCLACCQLVFLQLQLT